ncbi:hypothetical protein LIER_17747 [Lithospermum erythrorhizon]|uniref:Reverse transcriptase domain-containing protein n=1 Tax=Lithospermum erythrorhizon TaxID=34254 RepID=A0AAV3QDZ3_LITER
MQGFFKEATGVRQGDPLSPSLFVVFMEFLVRGINKLFGQDRRMRYITGLDLDVNCLSFADEFMLFSHDLWLEGKISGSKAKVDVVAVSVLEKDSDSMREAELGLKPMLKDFEESMGDFCKEFKVRSAPTSPKGSPMHRGVLSKVEDFSIRGGIHTDGDLGDGLIFEDNPDDSQGVIDDGVILSPDARQLQPAPILQLTLWLLLKP